MFTDPDVLILDEPTRGIDVGAKYEIYAIINRLADEGKGVIVISSELPELLGICDRIYTLSAGRHHRRGPTREATQEALMQSHDQGKGASAHRMTTRSHAMTDTSSGRSQARRMPDATEPHTGSGARPRPRNLRQSGIFIALVADRRAVPDPHRTASCCSPQNISNLIVQNGYILILAIGHGHGHHRRPHRPVGRVGGRVHRCGVRRLRGEHGGVPWWLAIILSLVVGALVGAWQGFWIAYVGIPAFIVTLAGMLIFRGLALVVLGNANIGSFPTEYRAIGNGFLTDLLGEYQVDPVTMGVAIIAIVALAVTQTRARHARQSYGQDVEPVAWFVSKLVARLRRRAVPRLRARHLQGHCRSP